MLEIVAIGNVGNEPEEKTLDGGRLMVKFRLGARHRENKEYVTTWINVAVFGKTAENAKRFLHKGSKIYVRGNPTVKGYKNKMEEIAASIDIVADVIEFCGNKGDSGEADAAPAPVEVEVSDIPF